MKKALFLLIALITFSTVTKAQYTKPDIKGIAKKAADATDKEFKLVSGTESKLIAKLPAGSDTLELTKDAKFIKVNGKTIDVAILNSALLIVSNKDVEAFLTGIQEYPAKIANPFTQYFLKFFGLTIAEPPKNAQK